MATYRCKYGLYHDKPTINNEPSSNNGWIYTAYASNLGLEVPEYIELLQLRHDSMVDPKEGFWINRLPGLIDPPISHDEIVGMISLGVLDADELKSRNWSMTTVSSDEYSLLSQLKAVWSLRGQHRNYVHYEAVLEAYPIVFRILPHLRYYSKKLNGKRPTILEWFAFNTSILLDLLQPSAWASTHNLSTLMLEDLDSWFWIRFYDKKENYMDYFRDGHPFKDHV